MKLIVPDYYHDFVCIADRCKHSCCIGWEIDIDEETLEIYRNVSGDFGKRLQEGIETDECGSHFRLCEDERCPFLNRNGLCDIILNIGEENLSQICTDHPRFCSFYSDRTELGLGLCCEEAARMILSKESKTDFVIYEDDGEEDLPTEKETIFFEKREKLFALAQNRSQTVFERMETLQKAVGISLPSKSFAEWTDILLSFEIMDENWKTLLLQAREKYFSPSFSQKWETPWEQILIYFLYRHISDIEKKFAPIVLFAILGVKMIQSLFAFISDGKEPCREDLIEICRLYSSEIEYSEENTDKLLFVLTPSMCNPKS